MKKLNLFIISLIIFSFGIYIFKNYFLGTFETNLNNHVEDTYIDPIAINSQTQKIYKNNSNNISTGIIEELNSGSEFIKSIDDNNKIKKIYKISFSYFPDDFINEVFDYNISFKSFLYSSFLSDKIDNLKVELYQEEGEVRGKMKNHRIKLFGVKYMEVSEFNAVGIHEFAHFIDLYYFQKRIFTDVSDFFYNISWEGSKVMKPGQETSDFVSGYAMTNKYEDFAETFAYFILHNGDFLKKSNDSVILKRKYDFLDKYLFRKGEFRGTNFSKGKKIESYYRDITKIDFSLENFLEFLKK